MKHHSAFTLIELLVVIAIIAILAGLAFPAVQGAMESGKRAQARNDVNQLAAAVKAYQLEYGKLPPEADMVKTLINQNTGANPNPNPRGIIFFEPKMAKRGKNGWDGSKYLDPWGYEFEITLDTDYNNKMTVSELSTTGQKFSQRS